MGCCSNNNTSCNCISDILAIILKLQDCDQCCDVNGGCDRPFLGPTPSLVCFNTRPINLYRCGDGELWTLPFTFNGTTGTSNVFRIENLEGCCATFRILTTNPDATDVSPYVATDSFFTINLNCVAVISCLPDVVVTNI